MLLRELEIGQRFEFSDKGTPIALVTKKGQHTAKGAFTYLGVGENACPVLAHAETGTELIAVSNTFYRWVLRIF